MLCSSAKAYFFSIFIFSLFSHEILPGCCCCVWLVGLGFFFFFLPSLRPFVGFDYPENKQWPVPDIDGVFSGCQLHASEKQKTSTKNYSLSDNEKLRA